MGNKPSQTQQSNAIQKNKENQINQENQANTYTQVTIKELNNAINNAKTKDEQEKKLKEDTQLKLAKEYLYFLDLGKMLLDAANKKENKVQIVSTKPNSNIWKYYESNDLCKYRNQDDTWSKSIWDYNKTENRKIGSFVSFSFTNDNLEQFLDDYKIFVKDVLKLDVEIRLVKENNNLCSHYEASWE
jgi:hypothetical protein